jgi:hypothetical protein
MDSTQMASTNYSSSSMQNMDFPGLPAYPSPARSESSSVHPTTSLGMYEYDAPTAMRTLSHEPSGYTSAPGSTHPWSSGMLTAAPSSSFTTQSSSWSELAPVPTTMPGWNPAFSFDPSHPEPGASMSPGLPNQLLPSDRSSVSSCEQSSGTFSREGTDPLFPPIKSEYPSHDHPSGIGIHDITMPLSPPQAHSLPMHSLRSAKPYGDGGVMGPLGSLHGSLPGGRHSFFAHPPRKVNDPKVNDIVPRERRRREFTTEENAHFRCDVCNRLFQRSYNYKKHMEVHNPKREKPHVCECGRKFVRPADYKRHVKSVSTIRLSSLRVFLTPVCRCTIGTRTRSASCAEPSFPGEIRFAGEFSPRHRLPSHADL